MFRGAKKRTFRFGKKNVSFPKVETFRFADYINKLSSVHKYSEINFHLILFPVPDKTKIVNWFISQAKNLKNDADE